MADVSKPDLLMEWTRILTPCGNGDGNKNGEGHSHGHGNAEKKTAAKAPQIVRAGGVK